MLITRNSVTCLYVIEYLLSVKSSCVYSFASLQTSEEWLEKVQKVRFPNQARPLPISDILRRIQEVVSARLYTITKEMVDLDYARINAISKEGFKTICDHHFMRLNDDQVSHCAI